MSCLNIQNLEEERSFYHGVFHQFDSSLYYLFTAAHFILFHLEHKKISALKPVGGLLDTI